MKCNARRIIKTTMDSRRKMLSTPAQFTQMHFCQKSLLEKEPIAVLSANIDYWQDTGFKIACRQRGIPFIAISREHPIIPYAIDEVACWYNETSFSFEGDKVVVAGDSTKNVLTEMSRACSSDQVHVTGLPRFDVWRDIDVDMPLSDRKFVTLLTFTQGYAADQTFKDVLVEFCNAAKRHKSTNVKFLVKTKDMDDTEVVKSMLYNYGASNITCSHDIPLFDALPQSRLVINYNSLSLIEAALAKAPIAIPAFGECKATGPFAMYPSDNPVISEVVKFAKDKQSLSTIIDNHISNDGGLLSDTARLRFVREYIEYHDEITSSHRVANLISNSCLEEKCT